MKIIAPNHPFLIWLIHDPEHTVNKYDVLLGSIAADAFNQVLSKVGFPIRIGDKGIEVNESGFEDPGPVNPTSAVGKVLEMIYLLTGNPNGLTCWEQPEAGLHPSWQGPMAELLLLSVTGDLYKGVTVV